MYKIYCISFPNGDKYYGHTKRYVSGRVAEHKYHAKINKGDNPKLISNLIEYRDTLTYKTVNEVETYDEALVIEDMLISENNCLNLQRAKLTKEEKREYLYDWMKNNRDKVNAITRKWYHKKYNKSI